MDFVFVCTLYLLYVFLTSSKCSLNLLLSAGFTHKKLFHLNNKHLNRQLILVTIKVVFVLFFFIIF